MFFYLKPHILWTKISHWSEIFGLLSGWMKIHEIPHVIFEITSLFSLNFASLFNVMGDESSVFFSWNFIWFLQKEPSTVQNFRLLTAQVKFHQMFTLIGYFCWKYIKFELKKIWTMSLMIPKSGAKFEEKLIFCFKNDNNLVNFDPNTKKSKTFVFWLVPFAQNIQRLT